MESNPDKDDRLTRIRSTFLGGEPMAEHLLRGEFWELNLPDDEYLPILKQSDHDPESHGSLLLHGTTAWITGSSNSSLYDPMSETPSAFLRFARFGELVWANGMTWNEELAEDTVQLLEEFGPLTPRDYPIDLFVRLHSIWEEARRLATTALCIQSITPGSIKERRVVVNQIIELYKHSLDHIPARDVDPINAEVHEFLSQRLNEWSLYEERHEPFDNAQYIPRVHAWIKGAINSGLDQFGVRSQIDFSSPSRWVSSYKATSLGGALWAQFAVTVLVGSTVRRCKNERCFHDPIFASPNPRKEYCSDLCKEARKKRMKRTKVNRGGDRNDGIKIENKTRH